MHVRSRTGIDQRWKGKANRSDIHEQLKTTIRYLLPPPLALAVTDTYLPSAL